MSKALQDETLLAFKMNGEDIPLVHGYPLRLVAGDWPASVSGKWVNRISIRNKVHDGSWTEWNYFNDLPIESDSITLIKN